MLQGVSSDLKVGFRLLVRNPAVTLPVAATLALGIGATVTMFSIAHGLLRELPVDRPGDVVALAQRDVRSGLRNDTILAADLRLLRTRQASSAGTAFVDLGAVRRRELQLNEGVADGVEPERYDAAEVSPWAFELLGVRPRLGRGFGPEDLEAGAPPVVILSDRIWRERYAGETTVIGRSVRVQGVQRTVVGVMPERFGFPTLQHLWIPFDLEVEAELDQSAVEVFGRLRPGSTLEQANAELAVASRVRGELEPSRREVLFEAERFTDRFIGSDAPPLLYGMLAVVSCVLGIACANVANLLLARSAGRAREMAVRSAIGSGRARIVRQLLAETLWLAVLGGLGGTAIAFAGVDWFRRALGGRIERFWVEFAVDGDALLFAAGLTVVATVLVGLAPALQTSRTDLIGGLRDAAGSVSSLRMARASRFLVVAEVGLSCVLVMVAALMGKGVAGLADREISFAPDALLAGSVQANETDYADDAAVLALAERLQQSAAERSELGAVAVVSKPPGMQVPAEPVEIEGVAVEPEDRPRAQVRHVTPEYFALLDVKPARGPGFEEGGRILGAADRAGAVSVAVVNVAFVERVMGGGPALGRRFRLTDASEAAPGAAAEPWWTIVGVVDDRGTTLDESRAAPGVLLPLAQAPSRRLQLLARPVAGVAAASTIRDVVRAVDPELPVDELATVQAQLRREDAPQRTLGTLFAVFATSGLVLAAVGIYGVLAFSVSRQTKEIGLRRALGADTRQVILRSLGGVFWQLGLGLVLGMGLAVLIAPALGQLLFGADPYDPWLLAGVPLLLALVAVVAAILPASRASSVDPLSALRAD